ncbi:MAG: nitroreductase family protein [Gammaproteobacteria bacterium]|jgi:nitroreductase
MNFQNFCQNRRSIRKFNNTIVTKSEIEALITAAIYAPSHCNTQEWRFIIVTDKNKKQQLVDHGGSIVINTANAGVLVCYQNNSDNLEYHDWIQSASAAAQNILLQAHATGLGACWICHLPSKKTLRKIFGIHKSYDPICYIAIGHTSQKPLEVPRKLPLHDFFNYNQFPIINKNLPRKKLFKIILRKIYYHLPYFVKKRLNKFVDSKFVKKFKN